MVIIQDISTESAQIIVSPQLDYSSILLFYII